LFLTYSIKGDFPELLNRNSSLFHTLQFAVASLGAPAPISFERTPSVATPGDSNVSDATGSWNSCGKHAHTKV